MKTKNEVANATMSTSELIAKLQAELAQAKANAKAELEQIRAKEVALKEEAKAKKAEMKEQEAKLRAEKLKELAIQEPKINKTQEIQKMMVEGLTLSEMVEKTGWGRKEINDRVWLIEKRLGLR